MDKNVCCIHFFMKTILLLTSKKKLSYLILSLPINAHWLKILVLATNCKNLTDKLLSNITFTDNDIRKIIKGSDTNKAYGHDMINIHMLKLLRGSVYKSLQLIFRACLDQGISPYVAKTSMLLIFIKIDKQSIENYRPVSLRSIIRKAIERLLQSNIFSFFLENDLISQNLPGFKTGDSCINQLLSIIHEIFNSLDDGWEGVFLNISEAFDKVWHKGCYWN